MSEKGTEFDISKMKVVDLKRELKQRGLSTEGKKSDLIERLQQATTGDVSLLDETHDDLIDEDSVLTDEEEVLKDNMEESLEPNKASKRPSSLNENTNKPAKKIILNRKVLNEPLPVAEAVVDENKHEKEEEKEEPEQKEKVTIKELSMEERLERRKARFGNETATLEKRAARFGNITNTTGTNNQIEVLKKRAERFGTCAPVLEKAQLEEKKQARLNRFGSHATDNGVDDKKALRAARFQITPTP